MFCAFPYRELKPHISLALEYFGSQRMLWGGNYPAIGEDSAYINEVNLMLSGKTPIPYKMLHDVLGKTARKIWFKETAGDRNV